MCANFYITHSFNQRYLSTGVFLILVKPRQFAVKGLFRGNIKLYEKNNLKE